MKNSYSKTVSVEGFSYSKNLRIIYEVSNNMKSILPLSDPIISCWSHNAHELSIILNNEKAFPWFYSNFIQLFCEDIEEKGGPLNLRFYEYHKNSEDWFFYTLAPQRFIKLERVFKGTLHKANVEIIAYVMQSIDDGKYVYTSVDEYYIPGRPSYQIEKNDHDMFIFGYDSEQGLFHIMGYMGDGEAYTRSSVTYENFLKGYFATDDFYGQDDNPYYSSMYTLQTNYGKEGSLNIELIKTTLEQYLNAVDTSQNVNMYNYSNNEPTPQLFGLNIYRSVIYYIKIMMENLIEFDIRPIHLLWEHKKVMELRLEYLKEHGWLISEDTIRQCKTLKEEFLVLRNKMLKFRFTSDSHIMEQIIVRLHSIKREDADLIDSIIMDLQKTDRIGDDAYEQQIAK